MAKEGGRGPRSQRPRRRKPSSRPVGLEHLSTRDFNGRVGETLPGRIAVKAVYLDDGKPAKDVSVSIRVHQGAVTLGRNRKGLRLRTDAGGEAKVDAVIAGPGWSLIEVRTSGKRGQSLFFSGCSNEMTRLLYLYAQPCIPMEEGKIEVEISALNFEGEPVTGADLVLEAHSPELFELPLEGALREVGGGRYKGVIKNQRAGRITLLAQDRSSLATGSLAVTVVPGEADHFAVLGDPDPRLSKPYNELDLRVQLQDKRNNPLDPARIQALDESGKSIAGFLEGQTAVFKIRALGYTRVSVTLADSVSKIRESLTIPFAATWLEQPGLVLVDETFKTPLYVLPPRDRVADHGSIEVAFDPKRVVFKEFIPTKSKAIRFNFKSRVIKKTLFLVFESSRSYTAESFPEGMYLGDICWQCQGEGNTCFSLVGKMSPSTPPWKLCVDQKRRRRDCICVNIIYPAGNNAARNAGVQAANQVPTVISSNANVSRCCPVLGVRVHTCALPPATINARVGADGAVSSLAEWRALVAASPCTRANCINMTMVPFNVPTGEQGWTNVGAPGNSALDPVTLPTVPNVGAHEIGHALGLNHASAGGAVGNLMHSPQPHGNQVTPAQCQTIFQTLANYPC